MGEHWTRNLLWLQNIFLVWRLQWGDRNFCWSLKKENFDFYVRFKRRDISDYFVRIFEWRLTNSGVENDDTYIAIITFNIWRANKYRPIGLILGSNWLNTLEFLWYLEKAVVLYLLYWPAGFRLGHHLVSCWIRMLQIFEHLKWLWTLLQRELW